MAGHAAVMAAGGVLGEVGCALRAGKVAGVSVGAARTAGAAIKAYEVSSNVVGAVNNGLGLYQAYQDGDRVGMVVNGLGLGLGIAGSIAAFGRVCFAAGTPILTPDGFIPIEQLKKGDRVLCLPEDDPEGPLRAGIVSAVFYNYSPLLNLRVGGRTIRTTAEHPFWVEGRGWVDAHQLAAGDRLRSHDGRVLELGAVEGDQEAAPVYNVEVAEYHTYFVGEPAWGFSVWAHNADSCAGKLGGQGGQGNAASSSARNARLNREGYQNYASSAESVGVFWLG